MKDKVKKESLNITEERKKKLKNIFPEVFTEDLTEKENGEKEVEEKINFDKLKLILGEEVSTGNEQYRFSWAGKKDAVKNIQYPSNGTLIPDKEESIDFDDSDNLFIEGDNLEVLKLLQKSYHSKVKMIYIDPPYNTGNDFVYKDNYKDNIKNYLKKTGQLDENGDKLTTNTESNGRFHSDWLNMMYPRLFLARNLLKNDGVIFISIDDNEGDNLKKICDEIFGEDNFFTKIIVQSNKRGQTYKQISKTHEYILVYTKNTEAEFNELEKKGDKDDLNYEDDISRFNIRGLRNRNPKFGRFNRPNLFYPIYVRPDIVDKDGFSPISLTQDEHYNVEVLPLNSKGEESCWRWSKKLLLENINSDTHKSDVIAKKKENGEFRIHEKYRKTTYKPKTIWTEKSVINEKGTVQLGKLDLSDFIEFPKPLGLLTKLIKIGSNKDDIILDFFAGSATTAHAVLEQNKEDSGDRKFICVQLPEPTDESSPAYQEGYETISDIAKERIRRVINGYGNNDPIDDGFKVFKLNKSNYKIWEEINSREATVEVIKEQLNLFEDSLVEDYRDIDVLYEIIIKEGYSLNSKIEQKNLEQNTVYKVIENGNYFYVVLDDKVEFEIIEELDYEEKEKLFICLDTALTDDDKINLSLRLNLKTI